MSVPRPWRTVWPGYLGQQRPSDAVGSQAPAYGLAWYLGREAVGDGLGSLALVRSGRDLSGYFTTWTVTSWRNLLQKRRLVQTSRAEIAKWNPVVLTGPVWTVILKNGG